MKYLFRFTRKFIRKLRHWFSDDKFVVDMTHDEFERYLRNSWDKEGRKD